MASIGGSESDLGRGSTPQKATIRGLRAPSPPVFSPSATRNQEVILV